MKTYKIGNKVKAIIRAYNAGNFAGATMQYDNEPYTIVSGVSATLSFSENDKLVKKAENQLLYFNHGTLSQVVLNDVLLSEKILKLIYKQNTEAPLCTTSENFISSDNKIYLTKTPIYQVFIYNNEGELEKAYGSYEESYIEVANNNSSYLVVYSFAGESSFFLNKPENFYCTVDLEIDGNQNDETTKMYIHLDKCGIKVDNFMRFDQTSNAVNLTLVTTDTSANYITVE